MLQAITVSLNYSDYLAETLPILVEKVDKVFVVTSADDANTLNVTKHNGAQAVITDAFWRDGAVFRKGAAINAGLNVAERSGWLLHIDADIVLGNGLNLDKLDENTLYGAYRRLIRGRDRWEAFKRGERTARPSQRTNRRPIGFFQLWHSSQWRSYPEDSIDACHDDIVFANSFENKQLLREVELFHLETTDLTRKMNWKGRKSNAF